VRRDTVVGLQRSRRSPHTIQGRHPFWPQRCRHAGRVASPIETTEDRAFQTESVGKLDDVAAAARGLADRATFVVADCAGSLPFEDGSFDAILCNDAICHLPDRCGTLAEWARLLRGGGRLVFTNPGVLTGEVAKAELDIRATSGFFLFVPPGLDEAAIAAGGLTLLRKEDRSATMAETAARWHAARAGRAAAVERMEGTASFERRQRFFAMTAELARSRRLSRFLYVVEKLV
jgi:SAM-dependent methyltransferase